MVVMEETWYKELEDPDTLYMKVTALKLIDHLTEFCAGLHTVDAVDIPQIMKSLYKDLEGVPQFINAMEAAQRKSKHAKTRYQRRVFTRCYIKIAPAIGRIQNRNPGVVETTRVQTNLGGRENYVSCGVCCEEAFRGGERRGTKNFWRFGTVWCCARQEITKTKGKHTNNDPSNAGLF